MRRFSAAVALAAALLPAGEARALRELGAGDAAPAFTLEALEGPEVSLADLAGSPAAVLFWSTWSPRSAEMLADFARYHEAYASKGLRVVAVNVDGEDFGPERRAAVRAYAEERALPFPVLIDDGLRTFFAWGVVAHPTEVVLDAGGRIAYVLPGYPLSLREELRLRIEAALGMAPPPRREPLTSVGPAPQGMALMHYNLGKRFLAKGDPERALASFRRSADEDPSFLEAALMQARVALALEDVGAAEAIARRLAPDAVDRDDLRYLLGMITLQKGEVEAAERVFASLEDRRPEEGWGAWGLGLVALSRGEPAAALPHLEAAVAHRPANPEGEALVRRWLRARWLRGEEVPGEDGIVALFPALDAVRLRYRNLRRALTAPKPE